MPRRSPAPVDPCSRGRPVLGPSSARRPPAISASAVSTTRQLRRGETSPSFSLLLVSPRGLRAVPSSEQQHGQKSPAMLLWTCCRQPAERSCRGIPSLAAQKFLITGLVIGDPLLDFIYRNVPDGRHLLIAFGTEPSQKKPGELPLLIWRKHVSSLFDFV